MGTDAKAALAKVKPLYDKLPKEKDAPPYLQADWKDFLNASKKYVEELAKVSDSPETTKARASYATKKTELATLETTINGAVVKQAAAKTNVQSAYRDIEKFGNKIGGIVKDTKNEPKAIALGTAAVFFATNANSQQQSLDVPPKVP